MLGLEACGPATMTPAQATEIAPQTTQAATATLLPVTPTAPAATQTAPLVTEQPNPYPLSEPGPFHVGMRSFTAEDASRDNRPVGITVWYPALPSEGSTRSGPAQDADPDPSGAPYSLIVSSTKFASTFAPYLISHGFTWASVDGIDTYFHMYEQMFEQPRDILFTLDQAASNPPEGLEGMIDAEHAGAIGYSFDSYNTLAMSGARIDPELYLAQCPTPSEAIKPIVQSGLSAFNCYPAEHWDEFMPRPVRRSPQARMACGSRSPTSAFVAVMPLAGEGWWLFGEEVWQPLIAQP